MQGDARVALLCTPEQRLARGEGGGRIGTVQQYCRLYLQSTGLGFRV